MEYDTHLFYTLGMLAEDVLGHLETPVQKCLPNDRRNGTVVYRGVGTQYLVAKLTTKATLDARDSQPAFDLTLVVRTSTALVETTIPLKPTVRICIGDPLHKHERYETLTMSGSGTYPR